MYKKETTVVNASGLHARPASDFVKEAKQYESKITVRRLSDDGEGVNAKSIIRLLSIGVAKGTAIEIAAEGPDEAEAVDALIALVDSGMGE